MENKYTKSVTVLVVLLSLHVTNGSGTECDFPAIYNFGDSNSDTGGLSAAFGQAGSPSGQTYFHQPAGRYCDGRLIIDFIGAYAMHTSRIAYCSTIFFVAKWLLHFLESRSMIYIAISSDHEEWT